MTQDKDRGSEDLPAMDYEGTEVEVEIYFASEHRSEHKSALEEGEEKDD